MWGSRAPPAPGGARETTGPGTRARVPASGRPFPPPDHSAARHRWVAVRSLCEARRRHWRQALKPETGMRLADKASCKQLGRKVHPQRWTEGKVKDFPPNILFKY